MEEFNINSLKKKVFRLYPAFGAILSSVKYEIVDNNDEIKTAGTNGKTIKINKDFMNTLTEKEQMFILAHEICHIAFEHIERRKGKDPILWNLATDAIINKNLEQDGLEIPQNGVNRDDALSYDAEELYELLLKEQKEKPQNSFDKNGKGGKDNDRNNSNQNSNVGHDDHGMWDENQQNITEQNREYSSPSKQNIKEQEIFKHNRKIVEKRIQDIMNSVNSQSNGFGGETNIENLGNVGSAKHPIVNWKKLLRKELENEDERWGYKFSDKGNNYAPRLEDYEYDETAQTDIILDTSGSVSKELLKAFLRQLKVILPHSKIRVATFSNDFHHDWQEIKCQKDIDNLNLYIGGGTNFDAASKAFTNDPRVNKICFTDGDDRGDALIMNKRKDIIWISFGNKYFKPDHGKVIYVNPQELNKFMNKTKNDDEMSM